MIPIDRWKLSLSARRWSDPQDTETARCSGRQTATATPEVRGTAPCPGSDRAALAAWVIAPDQSAYLASSPVIWCESTIPNTAHCGVCCLGQETWQAVVTQDSKPVSVTTKDAVLLARNYGYRLSASDNE